MVESNNMILYTFITIFIVIGVVLPFLQKDLGTEITNNDVEGFTGDLIQQDVGVVDVIISVLKMFFWSFGDIPLLLELFIFVPMRIVTYIILYDKIRGIA